MTKEKLIEAFKLACQSKNWKKQAVELPHNDISYQIVNDNMTMYLAPRGIGILANNSRANKFRSHSEDISEEEYIGLCKIWNAKDWDICDIDKLIADLKTELANG